MKIEKTTPDQEILKELGSRLARTRKHAGYSQTRMAEIAGIGVATLRRIEGGQDGQMASWIKIMKSLSRASTFDTFLPENFSSPMAEALLNSQKRKRTRKKNHKENPTTSTNSVWGDEA